MITFSAGSVVLDTEVLQSLIKTAPEQTDEWLDEMAHEIEADIVRLFDTSPAGREYGTHIASQPGFPPNIDTAALLDSMDTGKVKDLEYIIYAGVEYAPYLEFGTANMAKRPFFAPVLEDWRNVKMAQRARDLAII